MGVEKVWILALADLISNQLLSHNQVLDARDKSILHDYK